MKECVVALENAQRKQPRPKRSERPGRIGEVRNLEVWGRCVPVRVAGCDDDPAEPYIFRGID
ncbi:hypothetical protein ADK47_00830 [Streptomyces rimosus subsp. rimosus]|nr:hypothetical protein DF18_32235 [Streptomyces rimosus]KOG59679.1 hypothetical protein ADK76_16155 [Streptomyces griseoflavus]KOG71374.1 hypothetical protein ADK78_25155 [Kitasatospora aureofaciens]KOT35689.1 hypothetical protein ADK84_21160 [Streptomyces sp. NRRL WC-3701]KOT40276.1 hypothetical protein ADK42_13610 [Streptomyces rimosus subsp. rimosus]KOT74591.1 hypothetical protein ADK70_40670 [Streptomyces rimosus subsp. pseudoverticillatus]KOT90496.1 hypothetical protein ADK86_25855 [Str